ncbi:MAG: DUF2783 domain-containing protein [Pseudomonadota bacterium]|nr:DUF2783 domain-containing protein [Pseudomonadota bacterium]
MTDPAGSSRSRAALAAVLNTQPNISAADDFYQELVDMHRDLSEEQSALVNAKLILLLANHVGDLEVLRVAMRAAREDVAPGAVKAAIQPGDAEMKAR